VSRGEMLTDWTLFVFCPIFLHDHARRWNIMDLSSLHMTGGYGAQIMAAGFTLFDLDINDLVWGLRPLQARSLVTWLPTRLLLAFLAQTFRLSHKAIRRRRQAAILAVLREPILQRFDLLHQTRGLLLHLLDQRLLLREHHFQVLNSFITLHQLPVQALLLFSQMDQFFFDRHIPPLLGFRRFDKSPCGPEQLRTRFAVCPTGGVVENQTPVGSVRAILQSVLNADCSIFVY